MTCTEILPRRFGGLPRIRYGDLDLPVANRPLTRLLGLALLDREQAGPGLYFPRCRSVHTFGMRFSLWLLFLDRDGHAIGRARLLQPRRVCGCRRADAVIELTREPVRP